VGCESRREWCTNVDTVDLASERVPLTLLGSRRPYLLVLNDAERSYIVLNRAGVLLRRRTLFPEVVAIGGVVDN
jgi:hypothetical protein